MNFAKRLPLMGIVLVGACATPHRAQLQCGRGSELLAKISSAEQISELRSAQQSLTDKSDIYLLYLLHQRLSELERHEELRQSYAQYAAEILARYPEIASCESVK